MSAWPDFRPARVVERLTTRGVDFVVVGGFAAIAHGSTRITRDLDICFATDRENLAALGEVLVELKASLRGAPSDPPFVPDEETLRKVRVLTLDTLDGPLDVLVEPEGGPSYASLRRRAVRVDVAGVSALVASLDDLLAMKQAAGRPKDIADLEELEAIKRLRRRGRRRR